MEHPGSPQPSLLSLLMERETICASLALSSFKDMKPSEGVQRKAVGWRGHKVCEERLRALSLFSPESFILRFPLCFDLQTNLKEICFDFYL